MLTVTFDPRYPQDALESCAALAELLGDYITQRRTDLEIPERAAAAAGALCAAIVVAQDRATATINAFLADTNGRVPPMVRPALPVAPGQLSTVEAFARDAGVSLPEAEALIAAGLDTARRGVVPLPPASEPQAATPRLTEPRSADAKRRRAA